MAATGALAPTIAVCVGERKTFLLATTCRVSVVVLFALVTHNANGHTLLIVYLKQRDVT
jgi:hypothetical protein